MGIKLKANMEYGYLGIDGYTTVAFGGTGQNLIYFLNDQWLLDNDDYFIDVDYEGKNEDDGRDMIEFLEEEEITGSGNVIQLRIDDFYIRDDA